MSAFDISNDIVIITYRQRGEDVRDAIVDGMKNIGNNIPQVLSRLGDDKIKSIFKR